MSIERTRREDSRDRYTDVKFEAWWQERRKRGGIPSPRIQSKALAYEAWCAGAGHE